MSVRSELCHFYPAAPRSTLYNNDWRQRRIRGGCDVAG
jgi:hypothetical protein